MNPMKELLPLSPRTEMTREVLRRTNHLSARYGLVLKEPDIADLAEKQIAVLQETGRVEFGQGIYPRLVDALCDSPYLSQHHYADTLAQLCALFYQVKSESGEAWSDDELIDRMGALYNGPCQGSLLLLGDRLHQALHPEDEGPPREEEVFEEEQ